MISLVKLASIAALLPAALACNAYTGGVPTPTSSKTNSAVIEIAAGQVFDGGWARYDRGSGACNDQAEGGKISTPPFQTPFKPLLLLTTQLTTPGDSDAVFLLHSGATLRNVIIGANQAEGVHCSGPCNLEFVWFEDVCEDAITIKNDVAGQETWIVGGGAYHASDKVVQHNGCGTVNIINFYVEDYGKLYRSCGNVSPPPQEYLGLVGLVN